MSLYKEYQDEKTANMLWALYKSLRGQIGEELKPDKKYTVMIMGKHILMIANRAKVLYGKRRRW